MNSLKLTEIFSKQMIGFGLKFIMLMAKNYLCIYLIDLCRLNSSVYTLLDLIFFSKQLTCVGADVNLSDVNGNTALHLAAAIPSIDACCLLLDSNADTSHKNKVQ